MTMVTASILGLCDMWPTYRACNRVLSSLGRDSDGQVFMLFFITSPDSYTVLPPRVGSQKAKLRQKNTRLYKKRVSHSVTA